MARDSADMRQCAGCGRVRDASDRWYGPKVGGNRFCTRADCRRAAKAAAAAEPAEPPPTSTTSRKRPADDDEPWDSSVVAPPSRITEVTACLGIRCAPCPCAAASLPPSLAHCRRVAVVDHIATITLAAATLAAAALAAATLAAAAVAAAAVAANAHC